MSMIWTSGGMWFGGANGEHKKSEGPYGYLILGLVYRWDDRGKCLRIKDCVLVKVDMGIKKTVEAPLYEDMFRYPFDGIYEENGVFYYEECPIINYNMINIPETIFSVDENKSERLMDMDIPRCFRTHTGILKYSVNPMCSICSGFNDEYMELYSCILSFDERTNTGSGVGFDVLGKIVQINYMRPIDELFEKMIANNTEEYPAWMKPDEDRLARKAELGFLNLSYESDGNGNRVYSYLSIWDE